jgi:phosphodiesterase/alkaline phosphatase D-like protein
MEIFLYYEGDTMIFPKVGTKFWYRTQKSINLTQYVELTTLYPQEDSWYSFLLAAESRPQGHSAAGRIRSIEKSSDHIVN